MQTFVRPHDMVVTRQQRIGLFVLLAKVNNVVRLQSVRFVHIVILPQLARLRIKGFGQRFKRIAPSCNDVILPVAASHHMVKQRFVILLLIIFVVMLFMSFRFVVFVQVETFNQRNQRVGISRVRGISCLFQSSCPALVIILVQVKEKSITLAVFRNFE